MVHLIGYNYITDFFKVVQPQNLHQFLHLNKILQFCRVLEWNPIVSLRKKLHSHVHVAARNYNCSYRLIEGTGLFESSLNESMFEFLPFPLSVFFKYILYKNKLIVNLWLWFQILQQNYIFNKTVSIIFQSKTFSFLLKSIYWRPCLFDF